MDKTYRIYNNDEKHDLLSTTTKTESVFRFFRNKHPELYSVVESDDDTGDVITQLNGQVWLEENECPCCGQSYPKPLSDDEAWALDQVRPGPHY